MIQLIKLQNMLFEAAKVRNFQNLSNFAAQNRTRSLMDKIKDSGSLAQGSIPCGFTNIRLKLLIINLRRFLLRNLHIKRPPGSGLSGGQTLISPYGTAQQNYNFFPYKSLNEILFITHLPLFSRALISKHKISLSLFCVLFVYFYIYIFLHLYICIFQYLYISNFYKYTLLLCYYVGLCFCNKAEI